MVVENFHKENPKPSQTVLSMNEFKRRNCLPVVCRSSNPRCVNTGAVSNLSHTDTERDYCQSHCQALSNSLLEEVCSVPAGKEAAPLQRLSNYVDFFRKCCKNIFLHEPVLELCISGGTIFSFCLAFCGV